MYQQFENICTSLISNLMQGRSVRKTHVNFVQTGLVRGEWEFGADETLSFRIRVHIQKRELLLALLDSKFQRGLCSMSSNQFNLAVH